MRCIPQRAFCFQVKKMTKIILCAATLASAISLLSLGGCAYPDHSGVYMDQHNGREEQRTYDDRRDRRDNCRDGYSDNNRDGRNDCIDPRRQ